MGLDVSAELEAAIKAKVEAGGYASANEVLREGLRLLNERDEYYAYRLEKLREMVQAGEDQIARGETVPFDADSFIARMHQQRASRAS